MPRQCVVDGCERKYLAKGFCRMHYLRSYRGKDPFKPTGFDARPLVIEGDVIKIPLGGKAMGNYALADIECLPQIEPYKWHLDAGNYVIRNDIERGRTTYLHDIVMGEKNGLVVDHKNGDKLDNRRESLRLVTRGKNNVNRAAIKRSTPSAYKGVYYHKASHKWYSKIGHDHTLTHLGYFDNEIDAAKAYNSAALKYHKEYARLNKIEV